MLPASFICIFYLLSRRWDSNPRPTDYKSVALPTELLRQTFLRAIPFFGMAKVMENFIQQNFEKVFFRKFSTYSKKHASSLLLRALSIRFSSAHSRNKKVKPYPAEQQYWRAIQPFPHTLFQIHCTHMRSANAPAGSVSAP